MDEMVNKTQNWLNHTYVGIYPYTHIPEDGITGWTTIKALITALQIEIGIPEPNGNFGPATMEKCPTLSINSDATDPKVQHEIYILQGALFCKGYNPTGLTGTFGENTKAAVMKFQTDAGLSNPDGIVTPMIFKALLNMDAFVLINNDNLKGDSNIRIVQQNLNRDYNRVIGLIPCDGLYSRSTNKALIYGLQIEEGQTSPDGIWGSNTASKCPVLSVGSTQKKFILLLQYALYCNGFNPNGFDGYYGNGAKSAVTNFQSFCGLKADGIAGSQTFASLLVSTGDNTRKGTACDCSTTVTPAIAATIKSNGYKIVGRYLTGKFRMTSDELKVIFDNGLNVIPIFEVGGYKLEYFSYDQGLLDANSAMLAATQFGFPENTIIYFAVDFDALDYDVTSSILPYFSAINELFANLGSKFKVGIYAPRNVCIRTRNAGYSCSSFVCDMSTGFSGNLGYPLPKDWAFDQISTVTLHGAADIEIDNNIASGRDNGISNISPINILDILNNNSFAKRFGVEFSSPEAEIELLNNALVKISISAAIKAASDGDSSVIKFKGGEFEGTDIQTPLDNLKASLNKDNFELSSILAKANDMELSIKVSTNGANLKIELENSFKVPEYDTFSLSETLSIEFRIDKDKLLEEFELAVNGIVDFVKENPAIGVLAAIAIVAAIIILSTETVFAAAIATLTKGLESIIALA